MKSSSHQFYFVYLKCSVHVVLHSLHCKIDLIHPVKNDSTGNLSFQLFPKPSFSSLSGTSCKFDHGRAIMSKIIFC